MHCVRRFCIECGHWGRTFSLRRRAIRSQIKIGLSKSSHTDEAGIIEPELNVGQQLAPSIIRDYFGGTFGICIENIVHPIIHQR
jgi:hypothetical protein